MKDARGSWYLLTGVVIGGIIGLLIAWVISPMRYNDVSPAYLSSTDKAEYRLAIARAYAATGDLRRAEARLALLEDDDPARALTEQAQQTVAEGGTMADARALAGLATALGQQPLGAATSTAAP